MKKSGEAFHVQTLLLLRMIFCVIVSNHTNVKNFFYFILRENLDIKSLLHLTFQLNAIQMHMNYGFILFFCFCHNNKRNILSTSSLWLENIQ